MTTLTIPDAGLHLESSAKAAGALPRQAFGITLSDSMIEDMIRCVQDGEEIELVLGSEPCFEYGGRSHIVEPIPDSHDYDLFLTNPDENSTLAQRLPHPAQSLWKKPTKQDLALQGERSGRAMSRSSSSSGPESEKSGNSTRLTNGLSSDIKQKGKTARPSSKLLAPGRSAMAAAMSGSTPRSLPASPALNGVSSPNPAISASQQLLEKNKEQRSILVHELAARDRTYDYLEKKWLGDVKDLRPTLEKVASFDQPSNSWSLKKLYWKELDVWNYTYNEPGDRQAAIDSAVRQYDKQRIGTTSPEWERLLAPEERGKGKTLSKLQATLAKGNITPVPKVSVQKPDDGDKSEADSSRLSKGGEPLARSGSQAGSTKIKKVAEREVPPKKVLSSVTKKPVLPKKPLAKVKAVEDKGRKVPLSDEFVYDSSSSQDEVPLSSSTSAAKPKIAEKPRDRPVEKPVERAREREHVTPSTLPAKPKPVVRAPRPPVRAVPSPAPQKRARDDDDSSSSSGAPLSKRLKPKEPVKPPVARAPVVNQRSSEPSQRKNVDSSQKVRSNGAANVSSSTLAKNKNTSPTKSSPLASSPPTNASDFDDRSSQSQGYGRARNGVSSINGTYGSSSAGIVKKRKELDSDQESVSGKNSRVSKDVLKRANLFTRCYERYEALHREIVQLEEPPQDKLQDLLAMRRRLVAWKTEISREVAASA
ncbi:uncharacterized protein B0I36DRAFT_327746 [Microdochium trichocladiopsis]|uniref:Uncharacterized protein n=1 Tax=Microdochium trichocladiopsis TaxID=1682393 RepID=A0A9P8Y533_9PEZI|nr:uncharacterized protein B0I36DRAFT_327746 [Microdochium trichocladiopsis]KAH7027726.1 hypothetical protein B0I36DRAFT_327746 [Microdochium trichocladiopsis]